MKPEPNPTKITKTAQKDSTPSESKGKRGRKKLTEVEEMARYRERVNHAKAIRGKVREAALNPEMTTWAEATSAALVKQHGDKLNGLMRKTLVKALQVALLGSGNRIKGISVAWADLTKAHPKELELVRCCGLVKGEKKEGIAKFICPKAKSANRGHALVMWEGLENTGSVYSARIYADWTPKKEEKTVNIPPVKH
jgi:hypothetical protein